MSDAIYQSYIPRYVANLAIAADDLLSNPKSEEKIYALMEALNIFWEECPKDKTGKVLVIEEVANDPRN